MPALFEGYCYASAAEIAAAELSKTANLVGSGITWPLSVSAVEPDRVDISYRYQAYAGGSPVDVPVSRVYASCSAVGYQHNLSGLTLADVNELSWAVVFVWAAAWSIKVMRR